MNRNFLLTGLGVLAFAAAGTLAAPADKKAAPVKKVSYYKDVRPIFQANCQGCHQPAKSRGGYVMTDFKLMLGAGDSKEAAIVAKSPDKSHLVQLITPKDGKAEMPEGRKPLHATEIETIRNWIAQGAVDDTPANAKERYDMNHPPVYSLPPVITSLVTALSVSGSASVESQPAMAESYAAVCANARAARVRRNAASRVPAESASSTAA